VLKKLLGGILPPELIRSAPSSFEIIGSRSGAVAIVEIPNELEEYKYEIAKAIKSTNKNIKAVLRKLGSRKGEYRLYDYEVLIEGPTEVVHKEHGYLIKVDPTKVYFSSRDQTDRLEVAKSVENGERILYLFAGAGPYGIAAAKLARPRYIIAVEINPWGFKYMVDNIKLNKVRNFVPIRGDVLDVYELFLDEVDRVIMTLPLGSHRYLDIAIQCIDREGVIHFYHLGREEAPFEEAELIVKRTCPNCSILNKRIVRDYAPRVYKIRLDVLVRKI